MGEKEPEKEIVLTDVFRSGAEKNDQPESLSFDTNSPHPNLSTDLLMFSVQESSASYSRENNENSSELSFKFKSQETDHTHIFQYETNCIVREFGSVDETSQIIESSNGHEEDTCDLCDGNTEMKHYNLDPYMNDRAFPKIHSSSCANETIIVPIIDELIESCTCSNSSSNKKILEDDQKSLIPKIKYNSESDELIAFADSKSDLSIDESQRKLLTLNICKEPDSSFCNELSHENLSISGNSSLNTKQTKYKNNGNSVPVKNHIKELHVVLSCNDTDTHHIYSSPSFPPPTNIRFSISGTNETNLIADIRELRSEIENLADNIFGDSFGLQQLFKECKKNNEKSKSAKKRKKQKQKITKLAPAKATHYTRFAQSTEELDFSSEVEVDGSLTCPVCLEMYYLPRSCHPCGHIFCDPCLRRLTLQGWEEVPCPLCRTVIQHCELQQEFDNIMRGTHTNVYNSRATFERQSRFRHFKLPFTPPVPLGRRLIRHLRTQRARQSDSSWMSHDWFKFLLGCTVGVCTSMLIMLLNRVKSINDVRDVNIVFLSLILGASLTMVVFKIFKI